MGFARVKHFPEVYGLSYVAYQREQKPGGFTAAGYPEVFKLISESGDRPVSLTPALEAMWVRLLTEGSGLPIAKVLQAYGNLTMDGRAFTDRGSWTNGYQSVPLNENIGAEPMKMVTIIGGGATVKVISGQLRLGNLNVHKIEVMNSLDPATAKATYKTHWWMIYHAPIGYHDPYPLGVVETFPQLNDLPVRIPLMAHGKNYAYIESKWLEMLPAGIDRPVYPYYPIRSNMINYFVNTTVKIFETPSSASTQVGTMLKGNTGIASGNNGTWLHVERGWSNARVGEGMTGGDITWRNSTPPPVDPPAPPVGVTVTHTILIDNTGRISIDGGAYA